MKKGLTLIEVMVAALIFSFISAALYTLLRTGILVREKVEAKQGTYQNINLNLESIAQQIRNAVFFRNDSSGFRGDIEEGVPNLEFYSLRYDYEQACPKISRVKYWFQNGVLYKEVIDPFDESEETPAVEIMDSLDSFEIVYSNSEGVETGEWQDEKQIPRGVKFSLGYKDEKGRSQAIKKHIFIYRHSEME